MIEKTVRMSLLFDFYGQLLTERQQEFFSLYYNDDLSLGEIAGEYGVSRQAVYDILRRSTNTLQEMEAKLELVARFQKQRQAMTAIDSDLSAVEKALGASPEWNEITGKVKRARSRLRAWQ